MYFHSTTTLQNEHNEPQRQKMERQKPNFSWDPRCPEKTVILIHIQWNTTNYVRFKDASAQIMDEAERRDDERRRARELRATVRGRVVPILKIRLNPVKLRRDSLQDEVGI
jgi:hypothetical protein